MLTFPRAAVRAFRAVIRKGIVGRGREPAPPVVLLPDAEAVTFLVHLPAVVIAYRVPTDPTGSVPMVVPIAAFETVAGSGNDSVTIEPKGKLRAELRWSERGQPQTQSLELERFTASHERPAEPPALAPMPPEFLSALHEAGRTAGASSSRYAFDRIQLKGRSGEVIASDAHQVYLHGGFRFPFKEDLLLPALPIFGAVELGHETEIGLGLTETHVVLRIGPWTVWWPLDKTGRYPDVAAVVPKPSASTAILELDEADAETLQAALPKLPGVKEERRPVTLDLCAGQVPVVRARADPDEIVEVRLEHSAVSKGSVRVAVDRAFLARALRLGCRTFRAVAADRPVVARNGTLILLAGPLDPSLIAAPQGKDHRKPERALAIVTTPVSESEPSQELVPAIALPAEQLAPVESSPAVDPLIEAEALGAVLVEAGQRLGRLVGWFNARRREPRALARAWSRLQSLSLRPRGGTP
jgi:hypothetical protein